jgi:hypothetical protein
MSAIKRFFSSHKTSSTSKINNIQQHENQISQNKSSNNTIVVEKVVPVTNGTVDHEETKENMAPPPFPSTEMPLKYFIRIEFDFRNKFILLRPDIVPSPTSPPPPETVMTDNNEEKKPAYVLSYFD